MPDKFKISLVNKLNYRIKAGIPLKAPLCNAPFTNMLFVPTGKVMACHYNRGTIIGDINKNNLKDIWFGKKIDKLRNKIKDSDLSYGCQNCYYELKNKNYYLSGSYKYNYLKQNVNKMPALLDFQLENTCNLECIMCSSEYSSAIQTNREHLEKHNSPYNNDFIEQVKPFIPFLKSASFTGGEPFIIKIYRELWKLFNELNPAIPLYISTNASFIPETIKSILENGNFNFTVSIDSLNKEVYEKVRKNANLNNTLQNIEYLYNLTTNKNNSLSIKIVVMTLNAQELPEMVKYWSGRNIQVFPKLLWVPVFLSLRQLSEQEFDDLIILYKSFQLPSDSDIQKNNNKRFQEIIHQLEIWKLEKNQNSISELSKKDIKDLKIIFKQNLDNSVINDFNIDILKKDETLNIIEKTLSGIYKQNMDEANLKTSLIHFISLVPETIVAEVMRSPEKFIERFHYESKNK